MQSEDILRMSEHSKRRTRPASSRNTRLIGTAAIEDTQILFSIATADPKEIKSIELKSRVYRHQGPGELTNTLQTLFAPRAHELACIGISMPGTIDTQNATVIDIPRQDEWNEARKQAEGKQ